MSTGKATLAVTPPAMGGFWILGPLRLPRAWQAAVPFSPHCDAAVSSQLPRGCSASTLHHMDSAAPLLNNQPPSRPLVPPFCPGTPSPLPSPSSSKNPLPQIQGQGLASPPLMAGALSGLALPSACPPTPHYPPTAPVLSPLSQPPWVPDALPAARSIPGPP